MSRIGLAPFTVALFGASGAVAGMGLAVDRVHVITPAHVVNRALGREPGEPGPPLRASLDAAVPSFGTSDPPRHLRYTVTFWRPPGSSPYGDVAGLELAGGQAGPPPAVVYANRHDQLGECSVFGYPGRADLLLTDRLGYGYLEVAGGKVTGLPGYDGAPVTCAGAAGSDVVIGLLTTRYDRLLVATLAALGQSWPEVVGPLAERERQRNSQGASDDPAAAGFPLDVSPATPSPGGEAAPATPRSASLNASSSAPNKTGRGRC